MWPLPVVEEKDKERRQLVGKRPNKTKWMHSLSDGLRFFVGESPFLLSSAFHPLTPCHRSLNGRLSLSLDPFCPTAPV